MGLANLARIHAEVGDAVDAVFLCGTDFGTQTSAFCSVKTFRELYLPYYKRLNDWIHATTGWRTFKHSCGSVVRFLEPFIEAGFDILNPVQCSAVGMEAEGLKAKYGDRLLFWGGGIDTQKVLPFGTPEEVRAQVLERCRVFAAGGGFVFNAIHNVQARDTGRQHRGDARCRAGIQRSGCPCLIFAKRLPRVPCWPMAAGGTELQKRGLPIGRCPDLWNFEHPELVAEVARAYVDAGSRVILTNTFRANAIALRGIREGLRRRRYCTGGVRGISREAAGDRAWVLRLARPHGANCWRSAM